MINIKQIGLDIAEDTVKVVIKRVIIPFAKEYIKKSPNKIDDIILPFLDDLEKVTLKFVDKIDGEEG